MSSNVTLLVRVQVNGNRTYLTPQQAYERKLKGLFYLRFRYNGKREWECVGKDKSAAYAAKVRKELWLTQMKGNAKLGIQVVSPVPENRVAIDSGIQKFIERMRLHRSGKTASEFEHMLTAFRRVCSKQYLDEITGEDLLNYVVTLRQQGLAARTVSNRFGRVSCFLKANGLTGLASRRS